MGLSCTCEVDDPEWFYETPDDYQELSTFRRQRCRSCKSLIDLGAICTAFDRTREARDDIECNIWGEGDPEAIKLATWYLCEECSDLWFSLNELGFCVGPNENMRELVREYAELTSHYQKSTRDA